MSSIKVCLPSGMTVYWNHMSEEEIKEYIECENPEVLDTIIDTLKEALRQVRELKEQSVTQK